MFRAGLFCSLCLSTMMLGCSGSSGPKLAAADGEVLFQGKPLAGATVMFLPEKGPVAAGITDTNGKFRLSTGTSRGAVISNGKVTVTAMTSGNTELTDALAKQPTNPEESRIYMQKMAEMQQAMVAGKTDILPKSMIPEKYSRADTTPLSYPIKADGNNHFKIELQ